MDLPQSGWIGFLAAAICVPLILWGVNQRKSSAAPRKVAKAGPAIMALMGAAVLLFGIPAVLMVLGLLPGKDVDQLWVQLVFAGFALLAIFSLADGFVRRLAWSGEGLAVRNWGGARTHSWGDVASVDYKPAAQNWRIGFRDGTGMALSGFMSGARDFLEEARARGIPVNDSPAP